VEKIIIYVTLFIVAYILLQKIRTFFKNDGSAGCACFFKGTCSEACRRIKNNG